MNFEKPEKSEFWKNVYQKPQTYDVQFLRYGVRHNFLSFWNVFYPFIAPTPSVIIQKNKILKKWKSIWTYHFKLVWKKLDHMMYAYSDMDYNRHNFLSFQAILYSFTRLLTTKISIWKRCKKTTGDIIILHMCTSNQNHIMYGSWDKKCKGQSFFVILGHFLLLAPPNNPKNQNFEKIKKHLEILSFYTSAPQMTIIFCIVPEISSMADRFFCHFWLFFALLPL